MHDGALGALDRLEGAADEVLAALGEDLDGDAVGDEVAFDQLTHEVEVGLRRSGEADLDLGEADLDETVPHATLAHGVHRVDQRLVAVAKIDRAPDRGGLEPLVRPGAIGKFHGRIGPVLLEGHGAPTWR